MESCLPPVPLLISQRQRRAAIRVICSPPEVNPAMVHLHPSFPSLSNHLAIDSSRALTRGLTSLYLPLHWKTPLQVPALRNHLPIDAVAHRTIPFTHGLSRMPMISSDLICLALPIPPQSLMDNTYSALKKRVREPSSRNGPFSSRHPVLLPSPSPEPTPLQGTGQVHGRTDLSDTSREELTGRPPNLEVPRCQYLLPPLWSQAQVIRTRHPHLLLQTRRAFPAPPRRHPHQSALSPLVLSPTTSKARHIHQRNLHRIPPHYVSTRDSPLFTSAPPLAPQSAPSGFSCFFISGGLKPVRLSRSIMGAFLVRQIIS